MHSEVLIKATYYFTECGGAYRSFWLSPGIQLTHWIVVPRTDVGSHLCTQGFRARIGKF